MKIAILSDIHANQFALTPVLDEVDKLGISKIIIAGDTVGYYYGLNEVLELLNKYDVTMARGNHEEMLLDLHNGILPISEVISKFGSGLIKNYEELSKFDLNCLTSLQHPISLNFNECKILVSHGAPWQIDEYLYPNSDPDRFQKLKEYDANILVLGHTHHQMLRRFENQLVINPGSVGQNRSRPSYADWAVLDTLTFSVTFHSTHYDCEPLLELCKSYDSNNTNLIKGLK